MSEIQDKLNQILSNPEALRQVQSLGEQLGLAKPEPPKAVPKPKSESVSDDMMRALTGFAPLMRSMGQEDETTRLLNALRPFLSSEKCRKLDQAEKMMKFIKVIPMLKESGMFF